MQKTREELEIEKEALEEPVKRSNWPIILGAILMTLMILSYFFLGPFKYTIAGLFHSEIIEGNTINTDNKKIILTNNTKNIVTDAWYNNPNVETTLCLQGTKNNNTYIIDRAYQPKIYDQAYDYVIHQPCQSTIIMFHTQPYKSCLASDTDLNTLAEAKRRNNQTSMIIMCEGKRFNFYE